MAIDGWTLPRLFLGDFSLFIAVRENRSGLGYAVSGCAPIELRLNRSNPDERTALCRIHCP